MFQKCACGMPLDDTTACSCNPNLCVHCCECDDDCECACSFNLGSDEE